MRHEGKALCLKVAHPLILGSGVGHHQTIGHATLDHIANHGQRITRVCIGQDDEVVVRALHPFTQTQQHVLEAGLHAVEPVHEHSQNLRTAGLQADSRTIPHVIQFPGGRQHLLAGLRRDALGTRQGPRHRGQRQTGGLAQGVECRLGVGGHG